jgi:hypothetical protein
MENLDESTQETTESTSSPAVDDLVLEAQDAYFDV